ncbi:MAG TPA: hypothetical protein VG815_20300 [Chloroflexota bacterium]|nr:hypothetical protein [Chloroflexota bacterium]
MRLVPVTAALIGVALLTSPALASSRPAATYKSSHITFTYPSSWGKSAASSVQKNSGSLSSSGYVKVSAAVGVQRIVSTHNFAVAILAKMTFTKSFQKKLKGNRALFLKKFEQGVKGTAAKVVSSGTGKFAGQSKALEIQVLLNASGIKTHDAFYVAIANDGKTCDMAIMVVADQSKWSSYSSSIAAIAASSSFH